MQKCSVGITVAPENVNSLSLTVKDWDHVPPLRYLKAFGFIGFPPPNHAHANAVYEMHKEHVC